MGQRHKHADLIIAWAEGAEIEYRDIDRSDWRKAFEPTWQNSSEYRIKPQPVSVDWDLFKPEFKWAARDIAGYVFVYVDKPWPHVDSGTWAATGESAYVGMLVSTEVGEGDWKESLIERGT